MGNNGQNLVNVVEERLLYYIVAYVATKAIIRMSFSDKKFPLADPFKADTKE